MQDQLQYVKIFDVEDNVALCPVSAYVTGLSETFTELDCCLWEDQSQNGLWRIRSEGSSQIFYADWTPFDSKEDIIVPPIVPTSFHRHYNVWGFFFKVN